MFLKTLFLVEYFIYSCETLVTGAPGTRKSKNIFIFLQNFGSMSGKCDFYSVKNQQKCEKIDLDREHIQALMGVS